MTRQRALMILDKLAADVDRALAAERRLQAELGESIKHIKKSMDETDALISRLKAERAQAMANDESLWPNGYPGATLGDGHL